MHYPRRPAAALPFAPPTPLRRPAMRLWLARVGVLLLLACAFVACSPAPTPGAAPQDGRAADQSLVVAISVEPATLDPHQTSGSVESEIMTFIGASLVAVDEAGEIVPYLAERWEQSEDGLTWTFHLKSGITFQDGTPFTAKDYLYTFDRAREPEMVGATSDLLGPVASYEAPNDTTLVITLSEPYFPFLQSMTASYVMPLSQAEVERQGDAYGQHPMSVGPYRLKEWRPGEAIVLERNPDFRWGPAYAPKELYALESIEFRLIPDPSDQLVALEAGEVDLLRLDPRHMRQAAPLLEKYEIYDYLLAGAAPMAGFNVQAPPFDDERVRQAFNLALDREGLLQSMERGEGEPQCGPISSSVIGYWSGVEEIGCAFDLERAEDLLAEVGYERGPDGVLEREGEPLQVSILSTPPLETTAQAMQAQFEALGVLVEVDVPDGTFGQQMFSGDYQLAVFDIIYAEADILYLLYHSTDFLFPVSQSTDTELDEILERTRSTTDPEERQEWVDQAQQYIVEHAYSMPLYTPRRLVAVSRDIKGLAILPDGTLLFENAYRAAE